MKKFVTRIFASLLVAAMPVCMFNAANAAGFDAGNYISVISRENGSGTRTAFIELFGVEARDSSGSRRDMTTREAIIADKTDIVMTNIAGDPYAIGYISLGSLNGSVKALAIDGAAASVNNVKNGMYKIQRPFNIAVKGQATGLTRDFISFIMSREGQNVIAANKYIAINEAAPAYSGNKPSGKIVVAGSSSVNPAMEKLREAYLAINPNAAIEIQMSDSSAGLTSAMNGTCDIGMASRDLKANELAVLSETVIAIDGIAVIVNNQNPLSNMTGAQVKGIFTGELSTWSDVR